jgi:hypothetical protein
MPLHNGIVYGGPISTSPAIARDQLAAQGHEGLQHELRALQVRLDTQPVSVSQHPIRLADGGRS